MTARPTRPDLLSDGWRLTPLSVSTQPRFGGRWTSLRSREREWLWSHPDPAVQRDRSTAGPGDPFIDAGGVEECFPTVRGLPDHGAAWSVNWQESGPSQICETAFGRLRRTVATSDAVELGYQITGTAGMPFLYAVHALLDLSPTAQLVAPEVSTMQVFDYPSPGDISPLEWPYLADEDLSRLGPDDGSATCALLLDCRTAVLIDGTDALALSWETADRTDLRLCSLLLWRNLRGWPETSPYRSIGIEPMIGRAAELEGARPDAVARLDQDGRFAWTLRLSAWTL